LSRCSGALPSREGGKRRDEVAGFVIPARLHRYAKHCGQAQAGIQKILSNVGVAHNQKNLLLMRIRLWRKPLITLISRIKNKS